MTPPSTPWTIQSDANGHYGMREVIGPALRVVGFTTGIGVSHEHAQAVERDACLIATAPRLLAACIESLARFEQDGWPLNDANLSAINTLRDAIQKAIGANQ